ncbi:MAG: exodeoxyribonuclease VII small subunit [Rhodobacteraceae bacterium]|nr:exodeoxyribonuclease VII small subunit [Alphaproteobacteria bacterium]MBT8476549.1 exodeoxyribonuclease VII small subunit [Alphaproteobacteria bacterium]NNF71506.1 exodeoxyribonuclease VII small subunit [Paracoccaceae bacterium]NNK65978.1 exodeoxyribonuclease VII small subunit [Paracoccaceae bacterium]
MTGKDLSEMSFEEAMAELEQIVGRLDSGSVELEESITLSQRGAALKAHCEAKLKDAEEKVAAITLDENGQPKGTEPFEAS